MDKVANFRLGLDCNHKCMFCTVADNKDATFSTEDAKKRIYELIRQGINTINFTGGEPTIRDDLEELFKYATSKGIKKIELQTNGVRLSDNDFLKDLIKAGLKAVTISIHSHKKEIYNKITTSKDYEKAIKGLYNLLRSGIPISISHVINRLNYKELIEFCKFVETFESRPVLYFSFMRPNGNTKFHKEIVATLTEIKPFIHMLFNYLSEHQFPFEIEGLPLCYMNGYIFHSSETYRLTKQGVHKIPQLYINQQGDSYEIHSKIHSELKVKSEKCRNCILDKLCVGIWKEYAEIHGVLELTPIKKEVQDLGLGAKCNNSCIMCTNIMPLPRSYNNPSKEQILQKIETLAGNESITVTGGEPTIRKDIFEILEYLNTKFPDKEIRFITNSRMFSYDTFLEKLKSVKNIKIITELYGSNAYLHDTITRTKKSYYQTFRGIKNLLKNSFKVELRMVISKLNYEDVPELAKLYVDEFPDAENIVIFPIDIIGNAFENKKETVIKISEMIPYICEAIEILKSHFKDIELYHIPFCLIAEEYWEYVSGVTVLDERVTFSEKCENCIKKEQCSRLWKSYVRNIGIEELKPITGH